MTATYKFSMHRCFRSIVFLILLLLYSSTFFTNKSRTYGNAIVQESLPRTTWLARSYIS